MGSETGFPAVLVNLGLTVEAAADMEVSHMTKLYGSQWCQQGYKHVSAVGSPAEMLMGGKQLPPRLSQLLPLAVEFAAPRKDIQQQCCTANSAVVN